MIDSRGISQVARLMIRTHGENAETVASEHVDERLAHGDGIGRDVWRQIVAARVSG